MAQGHAFVFGAQPSDVAENVYEMLTGAWEALGGAERQAIIVCICALVVFYFVVRRARRLGEAKEEVEEKDSEEQIHLLEAVQARACENEVLHEKLQTQVYRGRLLRKEMRWLKECLRVTQEGLQELRSEHEELRAALTDSGGSSERNSGPEGDAESRPASSRNDSRGSSRPMCPKHNVPLHCPFHNPLTPTQAPGSALNAPSTAEYAAPPPPQGPEKPHRDLPAHRGPTSHSDPPSHSDPQSHSGPHSHSDSQSHSSRSPTRSQGSSSGPRPEVRGGIPPIPSSLQPLRAPRAPSPYDPRATLCSTTHNNKHEWIDDVADSRGVPLPPPGYEGMQGPMKGNPDCGGICRTRLKKERERMATDAASRQRPIGDAMNYYY